MAREKDRKDGGTVRIGKGFVSSSIRTTGGNFDQTSWTAKQGESGLSPPEKLEFLHLTVYAQFLQCEWVAVEAMASVGSTGLQSNSTLLLGTPIASFTNTTYHRQLCCWRSL